jgi:hypothetical protein
MKDVEKIFSYFQYLCSKNGQKKKNSPIRLVILAKKKRLIATVLNKFVERCIKINQSNSLYSLGIVKVNKKIIF